MLIGRGPDSVTVLCTFRKAENETRCLSEQSLSGAGIWEVFSLPWSLAIAAGENELAREREGKEAQSKGSLFHLLLCGLPLKTKLSFRVGLPTSSKPMDKNPSLVCPAAWVLVDSRCCQVDTQD